MAKKVSDGDSLVLIEIGGNDLLANVSGEEFGRALEKLVGMVDRPGRRVVMFELPLLVHKIEYGRVQRRVAAEHHVLLIPKRFFIGVIGGEGAGEEGLLVSGNGAERMVGLVRGVVGSVLHAGEPTNGRMGVAVPGLQTPHPERQEVR